MTGAQVFDIEAPPTPDGYLDAILDDAVENAPEPDEEDGYHLTDLGNAKRLIDAFGACLRRCPTMPGDGWLAWDGKRWQVDRSLGIMRYAAKVPSLIQRDADRFYAVAKRLEREANAARAGGDEDVCGAKQDEAGALQKSAEAVEKWARRAESRACQKNMVELALSDPRILVDHDDLDMDRWLLNVQNGTVDLRTGRLGPHRREDMITKIAAVAFTPGARAERFGGFLLRIMEGRPEMVGFLRRALGYSIVGTVSEQVFIICWGGGSNGKGTLINTAKMALGDYAKTSAPEAFLQRRTGNIPNDIAALEGVRFVAASETNEGARLDEAMIKAVTGGDSEAISARYLNHEWFEFVPQFCAWLMTNNKPTVRGTDVGIWRRLRLIPFEHNFENDDDKDIHFAARLQAEELGGVLAWLVEGCMEWQRVGLQEPPEVLAATNEYRSEMDVIADFLSECCNVGPAYQADNGDLYKVYSDWCDGNGEFKRKHRWLSQELKKRGFEQARGDGRFWRGLGLVNPPKPAGSGYRATSWRAGAEA